MNEPEENPWRSPERIFSEISPRLADTEEENFRWGLRKVADGVVTAIIGNLLLVSLCALVLTDAWAVGDGTDYVILLALGVFAFGVAGCLACLWCPRNAVPEGKLLVACTLMMPILLGWFFGAGIVMGCLAWDIFLARLVWWSAERSDDRKRRLMVILLLGTDIALIIMLAAGFFYLRMRLLEMPEIHIAKVVLILLAARAILQIVVMVGIRRAILEMLTFDEP